MGTADADHPHDMKMKSLCLVETVVWAALVLLSQAAAKVRPNASGISRIKDGGRVAPEPDERARVSCMCPTVSCRRGCEDTAGAVVLLFLFNAFHLNQATRNERSHDARWGYFIIRKRAGVSERLEAGFEVASLH